MWSDPAGYYVYLPATFIYHWNPDHFPEKMDEATGQSFHLDKAHGKVFTKYTYGVALLQAPFFLIAHFYSSFFSEPDGYSQAYVNLAHFAGVFYGTLGLILLGFFLSRRVSFAIALLTPILIYLGSPVSYYMSHDTGMSHIYSFFLFAALLNYSDQLKSFNVKPIFVLGLISGGMILIRPTSFVFLIWCTWFWVESRKPLNLFSRYIHNPYSGIKPLLIFLAGIILVFIPQILYWYYVSGQPILYSYGNEGFPNLLSPPLDLFLFSPQNGLFPYSPLMLVIIVGMIQQAVQRKIYSGRRSI